MTHDELVTRAVHWLRNTHGCSVVFSEFSTGALEIPDAIGFRSRDCTVVECKVSRADFLRDQRKPVRRVPSLAMGSERYYMSEPGVIAVEDLPDRWGLLHVRANHVRVVRKSEGFSERAYAREVGFLVSMLRRLEIRMVGVYAASGHKEWPEDFMNQWIKSTLNGTSEMRLEALEDAGRPVVVSNKGGAA